MPPAAWSVLEAQEQRDKLAASYQELLDEFNATDLRSVGNYTVGRLIGKGSFGKVYLATHNLTNGSKVVLKSAKKDDQNLAREIHHHRQFIHAHIARLYEVIVTENLVWLVLEYCPGDELYHHLLKHGRMPEETVQRIFAQLVGAVSYVHMKGCVHRDLKLENILLDKHGNVKLVDFGFTREYSGSSSYLQTWCGTVCYSAPEMVKGEKYAGEKVDVWSLGIILYALLAGELPFDDDDEADTKARILKEDLAYPEYFPTGAIELLSQLLSKRPLLRPSMADILRHSWLTEHAPQQQENLKLQQPPVFSTQLEKDTLHRLRSSGVNTDTIQDHVRAQRCDGLAGWWALLIEKEERKEKRRQRRRREREKEDKILRRLSAASGRLLAAPLLREINEEDQANANLPTGTKPQSRGRRSNRSSLGTQNARDISSTTDTSRTRLPELPRVQETNTPPAVQDGEAPSSAPVEKDRSPSTSSTRRKPPPPPKDAPRRPAQLSTPAPSGSRLRMVQQSENLEEPSSDVTQRQGRKRIYQTALKEQLSYLKAWFKDSARRSKSYSGPDDDRSAASTLAVPRSNSQSVTKQLQRSTTSEATIKARSDAKRPELQTPAPQSSRPRKSTTSSVGSTISNHSVTEHLTPQTERVSLSLSPIPPTAAHSSYRRRSGLTGRKSTSSSVSSVRSIRVHLSHYSKASSASSASISVVASPNPSNPAVSRARSREGSQNRSAHGSTSQAGGPSALGISGPSTDGKLSRRTTPGSLGSLPTFGDLNGGKVASPFSGFGPPSPGMHPVFARQRRKVFKGPAGLGNSPRNRNKHLSPDDASDGGSRTGTGTRGSRKSGILEEEDEEGEDEGEEIRMHQTHGKHSRVNSEDAAILSEDPDEEEDVEEVDTFEPASADASAGLSAPAAVSSSASASASTSVPQQRAKSSGYGYFGKT